MKQKTAILITSIDDSNLSVKDNSKDKVALDYSIILNSSDKFKYLFKDIPENLASMPDDISRNWYRDSKGIDNHKERYSIGMMLEKRVALMISSEIKLYYGFMSLSENYHKIEIPKNYPPYLSSSINMFREKITFISDQIYSAAFDEFFNKRGVIRKIKVNKFSYIFRFLQKPFLSLVKNKIMLFPDWTYDNQKNNNYIYQNKVNIFKSFYFKDMKKNNDSIKFPVINIYKIRLILTKYNIKPSHIDNLVLLITNIINREIDESSEAIEQQYNVMNELLNYYSPRNMIIPDDGEYPWYNMLMQISHSLKIDFVTVLDGYLLFLDSKRLRVREDGVTPLVKNYATMGTLQHRLIGKTYPQYNRILIKTPILNYLKNDGNSKIQYEVLIMMPIPDPMNPASRWDMRSKYIVDVVNLLVLMNIKKIAIKIKPGVKLESMSLFLKKYFIKNNLDNIDFVSGYAHEAIAVSQIIIGQLGTTLYECSVMRKPYYIYEPIENGVSDINISNSMIDGDFIARNISKLSDNIYNKKNVKMPMKDLIDGPNMSMRIN